MKTDLLIVGAGVAGLTCAREAMRRGVDLVVLERSRGVGGRCATRRVDGQPIDHGVAFLHGSDEAFLAALRAVEDAAPIEGWPARIEGKGVPCQPRAFREREQRLAYAEGVNAFPKHLARDLPIRREVEVASIEPSNGSWNLTASNREVFSAPNVVLALPAPQMLGFVDRLDRLSDELAAAKHLLEMLGSHPCLTLLATYPLDRPAPQWDINYPDESRVIHLIAHDSAKREAPGRLALVVQALPCWSRSYLDSPQEQWGRALLEETSRLLGPWALEPTTVETQRWRYARTDRGMELAGPMVLSFAGGLRLGLAGEVFARGAGVEAAWLSGDRLARRLAEEDTA